MPQIPQMPTPPANMISPYGQTAPFNPQWTSFLPSDPNAVANGLTPQMLAGIQNVPGFTPPAYVPPPPPPMAPRQRLAQMMMRRPQNFYPRPGQGAKIGRGGSDRGGYGSSSRSAADRAGGGGGGKGLY